MNEIKALVKTTKSQFDIQMSLADKDSKTNPGINFVIVKGNQVDYINILTLPEQKFTYFFNPSKLSASERAQTLEERIIAQRILHPHKSIVDIVDEV